MNMCAEGYREPRFVAAFIPTEAARGRAPRSEKRPNAVLFLGPHVFGIICA
jgi:hypothetical protein